MNHVYRLLWSRTLNTVIPVPEVLRRGSRGSEHLSPRARRRLFRRWGWFLLGGPSAGLALYPASALALPSGGHVAAGQASLHREQGSLTVDQSSPKAIIDWRKFGIGPKQHVTFRQPGSSSVVLNRVTGGKPSRILGHLSANGQVFLVNPSGVYFGAGAAVQVGGLVASTEHISNQNFLTGRDVFHGSSTAKVVNKGTIKATHGGYIAFIGRAVDNEGTIVAPDGTVALAAGNSVDLTLAGNRLVHFKVKSSALRAAVKNGGAIVAKNGVVVLTAHAKDALLRTVVNNTGVVRAQSVSKHGGVITLSGGPSGTTANSGTLDASSTDGKGGRVTVTGAHVTVTDGAKIRATGASGGGTINVGGGSSRVATATLSHGAVLDASATKAGPGGQVHVLSDVHDPASRTRVSGTILAEGGPLGGHGGFAETSGHRLSVAGATIDTAAPAGQAGTWLMDPYNVTIAGSNASGTGFSSSYTPGTGSTILNTSIEAALNGGSDVSIQTAGTSGSSNGNITVRAPISWSTSKTLTLDAAGTIAVDAKIAATGTSPGLIFEFGQSSTNGAGANEMVDASVNLPSSATFETKRGSSGAVKSYTIVDSVSGLTAINNNLSGSYALGTDLDLSSTSASPIGSYTSPFSGTFDGLGHTISHLTLRHGSSSNEGFFSYVNGGTLRNVGLSSEKVVGGAYTGGVVGTVRRGTVSNSHVTGSVSGSIVVGGLVGRDLHGTVNDSYATATVSGTHDIGGLVGYSTGGIYDSYATGAVSGKKRDIGGLVGYSTARIMDSYATGHVSGLGKVGGLVGGNYNGSIRDSYATGSVSGTSYVGGLSGVVSGSVTVSDSYATGAVSGSNYVGGLAGSNSTSTFSNTYWDTTTTGRSDGVGVGSSAGATGLTTKSWLTAGPIATGAFSTNTWVPGYPFPVLKALPYAIVKAVSVSTPYGSAFSSPTVGGVVDQNGNAASSLVNTSHVSLFTVSPLNSVGTYPVGGSGATLESGVAPHQITYTGLATIKPRPLSVSISGDPTKTYDGNTTAALSSGDYTIKGFVSGQGATVSQPSGAYASPDAGSTVRVSASLSNGDFTPASGTDLSNYALPSTATGAGTIKPKSLSASITGDPTKTYDGNTAATLSSGDFALKGFLSGQGATVTQTSGSYASPNAGSTVQVSASLSSGDFTPDSGTDLGNYVLPSGAAGTGTIKPRPLSASIAGDPTKTYDGNRSASLGGSSIYLHGFVAGQGASVAPQTSGGYASPDAGPSIPVITSLPSRAITADSGTDLSNYVLPKAASGTGTIKPRPLSASIIDDPTKTYDGSTAATLGGGNYTIKGFVSGQGATIKQPHGVYGSKNSGVTVRVSASLSSGDFTPASGTDLSNYVLPKAAAGTGTIKPKPLYASITGDPTKTYDGNTAARLSSGDFALKGFVSGQGATVTQTSGTYASASAGKSVPVSASLSSGDFTPASGTDLSNYALPSTAIGTGTIKPKPKSPPKGAGSGAVASTQPSEGAGAASGGGYTTTVLPDQLGRHAPSTNIVPLSTTLSRPSIQVVNGGVSKPSLTLHSSTAASRPFVQQRGKAALKSQGVR